METLNEGTERGVNKRACQPDRYNCEYLVSLSFNEVITTHLKIGAPQKVKMMGGYKDFRPKL